MRSFRLGAALIALAVVGTSWWWLSVDGPRQRERPPGAEALVSGLDWVCVVTSSGGQCAEKPLASIQDARVRALAADAYSVALSNTTLSGRNLDGSLVYMCQDGAIGAIRSRESLEGSIPESALRQMDEQCAGRAASGAVLAAYSALLPPLSSPGFAPQGDPMIWARAAMRDAETTAPATICGVETDPTTVAGPLAPILIWCSAGPTNMAACYTITAAVAGAVVGGAAQVGNTVVKWWLEKPADNPPNRRIIIYNAPVTRNITIGDNSGNENNSNTSTREETPDPNPEEPDTPPTSSGGCGCELLHGECPDDCVGPGEECPNEGGQMKIGPTGCWDLEPGENSTADGDGTYCPPDSDDCVGDPCREAEAYVSTMLEKCGNRVDPWGGDPECMVFLTALYRCPDPSRIMPDPETGFICGPPPVEAEPSWCETLGPYVQPGPDGFEGCELSVSTVDEEYDVCNDPQVEVTPESCLVDPPEFPLIPGEIIPPSYPVGPGVPVL